MAKNISIPTTRNTDSIAMSPAMAGYPLVQNDGRHGAVREMNAVGRRWTKAVAMSTPVPKCRERKRNWCGTGKRGKRFAAMGKAHAGLGQRLFMS
jgi:hypothetical protein